MKEIDGWETTLAGALRSPGANGSFSHHLFMTHSPPSRTIRIPTNPPTQVSWDLSWAPRTEQRPRARRTGGERRTPAQGADHRRLQPPLSMRLEHSSASAEGRVERSPTLWKWRLKHSGCPLRSYTESSVQILWGIWKCVQQRLPACKAFDIHPQQRTRC